MKNIFNFPGEFKEEIIKKIRIPKEKRKIFNGQSVICVYFTKFCDATCPFCAFESGMRKFQIPKERSEFSDFGFERFITFLNKSNNKYLLISGGGEPFEKLEYVMQTVSRAVTEKIVILTNGVFAKDYENAKRIVFKLYNRLKKRNDSIDLILRINIDKCHNKQLGFESVNNIITIFKENFKNDARFKLQIQTVINDKSVENIIKTLGNCTKTDLRHIKTNKDEPIEIESPSYNIKFNNGYMIPVIVSEMTYPNLMVNLKANEDTINKAINAFDSVMKFNEYNKSLYTNINNSLDLTFWINYNGNVTTWGNQQLDNLYNLYLDDYKKIISDTFDNILSYSFLDKGYAYREKIINEVNKKACIRAKAVNVIDYAGALILEETKTSLYYALRVIKDYLKEDILTYDNIKSLSPEILEMLKLDNESLKNFYNESNYTIFNQYMENPNLDIDAWIDLFTLINLGHYDVNRHQIVNAINFVADRTGLSIARIISLIKQADKNDQYERLLERITYMKREAENLCIELKSQEKGA